MEELCRQNEALHESFHDLQQQQYTKSCHQNEALHESFHDL